MVSSSQGGIYLIPGSPEDGRFDVLLCVINPDIPESDLRPWTDWVNEDLTDPSNSKGWSFRLISVVNPDEGLVLSGMSMDYLHGAVLAGLTVGVFSPTEMGSAVSIVTAYHVLYKEKGASDSLADCYELSLKDSMTRAEFDKVVPICCRSDLAALEDNRVAFRSKVSRNALTHFVRFQKLSAERQLRLTAIAEGIETLGRRRRTPRKDKTTVVQVRGSDTEPIESVLVPESVVEPRADLISMSSTSGMGPKTKRRRRRRLAPHSIAIRGTAATYSSSFDGEPPTTELFEPSTSANPPVSAAIPTPESSKVGPSTSGRRSGRKRNKDKKKAWKKYSGYGDDYWNMLTKAEQYGVEIHPEKGIVQEYYVETPFGGAVDRNNGRHLSYHKKDTVKNWKTSPENSNRRKKEHKSKKNSRLICRI